MNAAFYLAAAVAVISTAMVITRLNAVHALLYLIVSLLAVAVIFFLLGAPFVAALEVIIYAGAIMVLFLFILMLLNLGHEAAAQEAEWLPPHVWIVPVIFAAALLAELVYVMTLGPTRALVATEIGPKQVGISLFGPYLLGAELASMLLLSGMIGAYHLGRRDRYSEPDGEEGR